MTDASPLFIADTNILIDLWEGELLPAFFQLPYTIASPDVVIAELQRPEGSMLVELGLQSLTLEADLVLEVIALRQAFGVSAQANAQDTALRSHYKALSTPDLFAFVAARNLGAILLTGDAGLRQLAETHRVPLHGILWVMDEMVRTEIISSFNAAGSLKRILEAGARLPESSCEERFRRWRKP